MLFIIRIVGYGATSVVYKALMATDKCYSFESKQKGGQSDASEDVAKGRFKDVAIKKVRNIFENNVYTHRVLREIRLMRLLSGHRNVSKHQNSKTKHNAEN